VDIGDRFENAFSSLVDFLPNLIGFLIILVVGYIVAKVVSSVVGKLLQKVGLDRRLHESDAHTYVDRVMPNASPSSAIASVVFWLIFVFFLFSAIGALEVPALTGFMEAVLAYLPNVIVAILIFVVAALIAGAVAGGVGKVMGDTPTGKIVATVVPALVMVIAMFMILEQLQIAPEIVRIAFAATMGALALGLALAFGLGGRQVAQRLLEDAYSKSQDAKERVRSDMQTGRDRVQEKASDSSLTGSSSTGASTGTTTSTTTDTGYTGGQTTSTYPAAGQVPPPPTDPGSPRP
jgi:small-conductance mechanosensitive channel